MDEKEVRCGIQFDVMLLPFEQWHKQMLFFLILIMNYKSMKYAIAWNVLFGKKKIFNYAAEFDDILKLLIVLKEHQIKLQKYSASF